MREVLVYQESDSQDLVPAFVNLINLSHGVNATTDALFRWKHFQSPFGHSLIIYMVYGDQIIGLRCSQFYRFTIGDRLILAAQSCDVATHPDFQCQGVARVLINRWLELLSERQIDCTFGFPNKSSKKVSLSTGALNRKAQILLTPVPLLLLAPFFMSSGEKVKIEQMSNAVWEQLGRKKFSSPASNDQVMRIEKDSLPAWIQWRFRRHPLNSYLAVKVGDVYFIGKLIHHRIFREFRILEIIGDIRCIQAADFLKKYPNTVPTFQLGEEHEAFDLVRKRFLAKKHVQSFYVMRDLSGCFNSNDTWNLSGSWTDYA
jgi:ribosomal protein S18 acetylase RimI-like enzyme